MGIPLLALPNLHPTRGPSPAAPDHATKDSRAGHFLMSAPSQDFQNSNQGLRLGRLIPSDFFRDGSRQPDATLSKGLPSHWLILKFPQSVANSSPMCIGVRLTFR